MSPALEKIAKEALALDHDSRAELADLLVVSLAEKDAEDVHRSWLVEMDRRVQEIRSGEAKMIDGDEAIAMARRAAGRR